MDIIKKPNIFRGNKTGLLIGLEVTINGGDNTQFDIASGSYMIKNTRYEYGGSTGLSVLAARRTYVFLDTQGQVVKTGVPLTLDDIASKTLLAVIYHPAGTIINIFTTPFDLKKSSWEQTAYNYTAVGAVVSQGLSVVSNTSPPTFNMMSGRIIGVDGTEINIPLANPLNFIPVYRNGSGGWTFDTITDTIQFSEYDGDGSGTLLSMVPGNIRADMLYYSTYDDRFYLLYGQELQSTFDALHIHRGNYDFQESTDGFFRVQGGLVPIARVYVQQGNAIPISVVDSRRAPGLQTLLGLSNIETKVEEMTKPANMVFLGLFQGMTNVQMFEVSGVVSGVVMPKAGFIVAHTAQLNTPLTAGTVDLRLTKGGSTLASTLLDLQLNITDPAKKFATIPSGDTDFRFNANEEIGTQVSSSAGFTPVGASVTSKIYVKFDD